MSLYPLGYKLNTELGAESEHKLGDFAHKWNKSARF